MASPRRTVAGVNPNRVALILAVLEKRAGIHISDKEVYVNVAGGVRLEEPAIDLAVAVALASSLLEAPVPSDVAIFGEIGLAGEVRAVDMARSRVAEASKFGFIKCILPKSCAADVRDVPVEIVPVTGVASAIDVALDR
jgi:DNA repair protein RadA/Sms